MKLTEENLKQILQRQTARSTARHAECLTEDQFARVAGGEMDQEERSAVARHLIVCADCTEEYRILRSLKSWANETDLTLAATLPPAARKDDVHPVRYSEVARPTAWNGRNAFSSSRVALALAAMLLVVLAAGVLLVWNSRQQSRELARLNQQVVERERALNSVQESLSEKERRVGELEESLRRQARSPDQSRTGEGETGGVSANNGSNPKDELASLRQSARELNQPQLEVPIVDLDPAPLRGGPSRAATIIDIPSTAKSFTVILNFSGEAYGSYQVELLDSRGRNVWHGQVQGKSGSGSINLTLARGLIADGNYLIELYGLKNRSKERVASYPIKVRYQAVR
jgi:hypothetical protein